LYNKGVTTKVVAPFNPLTYDTTQVTPNHQAPRALVPNELQRRETRGFERRRTEPTSVHVFHAHPVGVPAHAVFEVRF
jgi:hypothetical protein